MRWFPAMVSNHVMDLIERYGEDSEIPTELTDYVKARKFYDYKDHSRVGAAHGEFVTDEICDRFCVIGSADAGHREAAGARVDRRRPVQHLPHDRTARRRPSRPTARRSSPGSRGRRLGLRAAEHAGHLERLELSVQASWFQAADLPRPPARSRSSGRSEPPGRAFVRRRRDRLGPLPGAISSLHRSSGRSRSRPQRIRPATRGDEPGAPTP